MLHLPSNSSLRTGGHLDECSRHCPLINHVPRLWPLEPSGMYFSTQSSSGNITHTDTPARSDTDSSKYGVLPPISDGMKPRQCLLSATPRPHKPRPTQHRISSSRGSTFSRCRIIPSMDHAEALVSPAPLRPGLSCLVGKLGQVAALDANATVTPRGNVRLWWLDPSPPLTPHVGRRANSGT